MKAALILVTLIATVWAYPQSLQSIFKDFPMKRVSQSQSPYSHDFYPDTRILEGNEVAPDELPYQVWMLFWVSTSTGGWSCGGSLITKKFVLTAGHCGHQATYANVFLGYHNLSTNEDYSRVVKSSRIIVHPNFDNSNTTNDVALIELETEMELNEYINVVRLPPRSALDNLFKGESVKVSGWGMTAADSNLADVLMAVNSTVLANDKCHAVFNNFRNTQLCISNEEGVGTCYGDSGGPLVSGNVLIGIVSYGRDDCLFGPTVFTRVTSYFDWIVDNSDYVPED